MKLIFENKNRLNESLIDTYMHEGINSIIDPNEFMKKVFNGLYEAHERSRNVMNFGHFNHEVIERIVKNVLLDYNVSVDFRHNRHAHNIGNNNEWDIYLYDEEEDDRIQIGRIWVTYDVYGGCYMGIFDLNGKLGFKFEINSWNIEKNIEPKLKIF